MMTATTMPERRWGDEDEPEPVRPVVRVSSHDGAPVPRVAGAAKLAAVAQAHGWAVVQTYACADWPDRPRKPAHTLESVAVRMSRRNPREHGFAIWHRIDEGGWRFVCAYVRGERHQWRSILGRVAR